jgi:hypothetical protein
MVKPKIIIRPIPPVPEWIFQLHKAFIEWWAKHNKLEHRIDVILYPRINLPASLSSVAAFGQFTVYTDKTLAISLTCRPHDKNRTLWPGMMLHVFAHELVHYEQYRDGRKLGHRGVQNRAWSLARKFIRSREYDPKVVFSPQIRKLMKADVT